MPPSSRAAAKKEASASASSKAGTDRFACDQCSRTYSRPDHLIRHKLNHEAKRILVCTHCGKEFVRQDLLARHVGRHVARGGGKLGRWNHRGGDGKSSTKEVGKTKKEEKDMSGGARNGGSDGVSEKEGTTSEEEGDEQGQSEQDTQMRARSPDSPGANHHPYGRSPNVAPYGAGGPSHLSPGEFYRYPTPSGSAHFRDSPVMASPGLAPGMPPPSVPVGTPGTFGDSPYSSQQRYASSVDPRDPVGPDGHPLSPMRSTYQMPPQSQYPGLQWGSSSRSASWPHSNGLSIPVPPQHSGHTAGYYSAWPNNTRPPDLHSNGESPDVGPHPTLHTSTLLSSFTEASEANPFAPPPVDQSAEYRWLFDGLDTLSTSSQAHPSSVGPGQANPDPRFSPGSSEGIGRNGSVYSQSMHASHSRSGEDASASNGPNGQEGSIGMMEADAYNALDSLAFFASLQAEIPEHPAFMIDDATHYRLIHFLSAVTELPTSPLFSPSALRCYVYLFFRSFNNLYPLIHEPTFDGRTADAMLLSSIIVIGAHYADNAAHELALRIARKLWGAYVSLDDFRPARATLPMLQAMLLTEAFGKLMSTRPLHETAHLFHTFLVTLARRNAVFTTSPVVLQGAPGSDEQWRGWAREEEKKRIALFAFILDAQHATIFRHIPALSAFQIQLQLPVTEHEWTQPSAKAWHTFRSVKEYRPPPYLITTLKAHLVPSRAPPVLDTFSRFVVLHGLLSIAYDMRWKHDILLGAESGPGGGTNDETLSSWRERLSTAFMAWKARLDASALSSVSDSSNTIFRASASMSTAAQIAVHADIVDFQIYAGLPSVLGRFIGKEAFCAARKAVKEWARTNDGRVATWHAVNFLRSSLQGTITSGPSNAPSPNGNGHGASSPIGSSRLTGTKNVDYLLHHQWVQYLCALVIWGYGQAHASSKGAAGGNLSLRSGNAAASGGNGTGGHNSGAATPESRFLPSPGLGLPGGPTSTLQQRNPAAAYYLDAMSTRSPEELVEVECISQTRGVLEVVERELRSSRWELGREAAGVLRKLIRTTEAPPLTFLHSAASGMGGTASSLPGLNAAASTAHQLLASTFPHVKEEPPRADVLGSPLIRSDLHHTDPDTRAE